MNTLFHDICAMIHGIESHHDTRTKDHESRTGRLMSVLGVAYGLDSSLCQTFIEIGSLHDIGKLAIPESILEKAGAFNQFERKMIELHPSIGYEFIKEISHPDAELAGKIILNHHENFDGTGYPRKLAGKEIPIEACICSLCDVYDALRENRAYRAGMSHEKAMEMITDTGEKGLAHKFHPDLLETFKAIFTKAPDLLAKIQTQMAESSLKRPPLA